MPVDASDVIEARRLRHASRDVFETQKKLVKSDLGAAGVGKRVASRMAEDGRRMADTASTAANEHRPLVALGALALTGWFLRKPLGAFAAALVAGNAAEADEDPAPQPAVDERV